MDNIELDYTIQHIAGNTGNDNVVVIERSEGKTYVGEYEEYQSVIQEKIVINRYGSYEVHEQLWNKILIPSILSSFSSFLEPLSQTELLTSSDNFEVYVETGEE